MGGPGRLQLAGDPVTVGLGGHTVVVGLAQRVVGGLALRGEPGDRTPVGHRRLGQKDQDDGRHGVGHDRARVDVPVQHRTVRVVQHLAMSAVQWQGEQGVPDVERPRRQPGEPAQTRRPRPRRSTRGRQRAVCADRRDQRDVHDRRQQPRLRIAGAVVHRDAVHVDQAVRAHQGGHQPQRPVQHHAQRVGLLRRHPLEHTHPLRHLRHRRHRVGQRDAGHASHPPPSSTTAAASSTTRATSRTAAAPPGPPAPRPLVRVGRVEQGREHVSGAAGQDRLADQCHRMPAGARPPQQRLQPGHIHPGPVRADQVHQQPGHRQ